jgi:hypothetical protein
VIKVQLDQWVIEVLREKKVEREDLVVMHIIVNVQFGVMVNMVYKGMSNKVLITFYNKFI